MSWSLLWVDHWSGCPDTQEATRDGRNPAQGAMVSGRTDLPTSSGTASSTSQPASPLTEGIDPRIAAAAHSALERIAQVQDTLLDPVLDPAPGPA
ncbi:hypothetical protein [Stappia sp.]|uniref:hypothetical protein n=1 Tax=Stappia sp. TaxID=1870903 RepID=UPI0032D954F5